MMDVQIADLDLQIRIPIPDQDSRAARELLGVEDDERAIEGEGFKLLTTRNIVKIIASLMERNPRWLTLMAEALRTNVPLEAAWKVAGRLEWANRSINSEHLVAQIDNPVVDGVLFESVSCLSLPLAACCEAELPNFVTQCRDKPRFEIRPAEHPTGKVRLPSGGSMDEPPAIEGYLWRVKAVSGALTRIYVTSQDGHIFICRSNRGQAPDRELISLLSLQTHPFAKRTVEEVLKSKRRSKKKAARTSSQRDLDAANDLAREALADSSGDGIAKQIQAYRAYERRRLFEQIIGADGYVDLRDFIQCRLVETPDSGNPDVAEPGAQHEGMSRDSSWQDITVHAAEDIGGEEGLAAAQDRNRLRAQRQFQITMANGKTIRFEAFSISVAAEWVDRLNELAVYWKAKEKADAQALMAGDLTHKQGTHRIEDDSEISHQLRVIWNWCPIMGCRPIVRCGRLFRKSRTHQAFKSRYFVLIHGRLLSYKLIRSTRTARARQNTGIFHKRQETVVHLRDAYVYSGKLTEAFLPESSQGAQNLGVGGGAGDRHRLPRVYRDGLQSFDDEEDCTFVIRYRPQRVNVAADPVAVKSPDGRVSLKAKWGGGAVASNNVSTLPPLGERTTKDLVLRARSRADRDLWVRALKIEIERLGKDDPEREDGLRSKGEVPYKHL